MPNLVTTYQLIADILSFDSSNTELKQTLSRTNIDWDTFVIEGSRHLVLPALYCRFKSKALLDLLPKDLITYLEDITAINRNRNISIIEQAKDLASLFNSHSIEHVFLKGTALLALNCYEDNAERMIGDIDILIPNNQIQKAYTLAKENGYIPIESTLSADFFEHKHLPRMVPLNAISALELHIKLFANYEFEALKPKNILDQKNSNAILNVPSKAHLFYHNVLNSQVNDKGQLYQNMSFRSAYDSIILLKLIDPNDIAKALKTKKIKSYLERLSLFFDDLKLEQNIKPTVFTKFYLFKLKHKKFHIFYDKILNLVSFIWIVFGRFYLLLTSSKYRKAVLADRKRVFKHLKNKMLFNSKNL